jgi:hypothetical protein
MQVVPGWGTDLPLDRGSIGRSPAMAHLPTPPRALGWKKRTLPHLSFSAAERGCGSKMTFARSPPELSALRFILKHACQIFGINAG